MDPKTCLITALNGGTPDSTPLSIYRWFTNPKDPRWQKLFDMGLVQSAMAGVVKYIEHDVRDEVEETTDDNGKRLRIHTRHTPVGSIRQVHTNGWHTEYFLKTPDDYKVMKFIVEHTEVLADYEQYSRVVQEVGENGYVTVFPGRSPAMIINIDWAGTEQFCLDLIMEVPELFDLYNAKMDLFMRKMKLVAQGPGEFIHLVENLTIDMIGPDRYSQLLVSAYDKITPLLRQSNKKLITHYDGKLSIITNQVAKAPIDVIESLTEPPEGDMTYDACRAAWPEKSFWANISVGTYALPPDELRAEVVAKRNRAGKRAFAFEISEELPANWEQSIPVVLKALQELG